MATVSLLMERVKVLRVSGRIPAYFGDDTSLPYKKDTKFKTNIQSSSFLLNFATTTKTIFTVPFVQSLNTLKIILHIINKEIAGNA